MRFQRLIGCLVLTIALGAAPAQANTCESATVIEFVGTSQHTLADFEVHWYQTVPPVGSGIAVNFVPAYNVNIAVQSWYDCDTYLSTYDSLGVGATETMIISGTDEEEPLPIYFAVTAGAEPGVEMEYNMEIEILHNTAPFVTVDIMQGVFTQGDYFDLTMGVSNPNPTPQTVQVYLVLIIAGQIYYWPSWSLAVDSTTTTVGPYGYELYANLLSFIVPPGLPDLDLEVYALPVDLGTARAGNLAHSYFYFR